MDKRKDIRKAKSLMKVKGTNHIPDSGSLGTLGYKT